MNRKVFCWAIFLLLSTVVPFSPSVAAEGEPEKPYHETDAFRTIVALNTCVYSLVKIATYNDRVVLDNEYTALVNAINLKNLTDRRTVDSIKLLMDTLTKFTLSNMDKSRLTQVYEKAAEEKLMDTLGRQALPMAANALGAGKSAAIAGPHMAVGAVLLSLTTDAGSAYVDYQQHMKSYKDMLTDQDWAMKKEAVAEINELNKHFLDTYWAILQESDAPDAWRITPAQISLLLDAAREEDIPARHRMLVRLEKECAYIPAYWYYRADAAQAAHQRAANTDYVKDIRLCLERYGMYRGFFRKDELYAAMLMMDVALSDYGPDELQPKFREIMEQDPVNASRRLFVAAAAMRAGLDSEAGEALQANLDAKKFLVSTRALMADLYAGKKDENSLKSLLTKAMDTESAGNQELLFLLGKVPDKKLLERFAPEILGIRISVVRPFSPLKKQGLSVAMPKRWMLMNDANLSSTLFLNDISYKPSSMSMTEDGAFVVLGFDDIFSESETIAAGQSLPLRLEPATENFSVVLEGALVPMEREKAQSWLRSTAARTRQSVGGAVRKAGDVLGLQKKDKGEAVKQEKAVETVLVFVPERIRSGTACFAVNGNELNVCPQE